MVHLLNHIPTQQRGHTALLGWTIRNNIARAYKIPSVTMKPALLAGDHLIADMRIYKSGKPKRGDVIIFEYIRYVDENDTIEGAPELKPEHLPVFDCAFKPANGVRSIAWKAHIRMMAAAQPFLSGAISKTVNMPADVTPADVADAYLWGWKLGLKALAIYRDGSTQSQPLNTKSEADKAKDEKATPRPRRERLPDTRQSLTHKFNVGGHEGYINVGLYPDGRPGELFPRWPRKEARSVA